MKILVTGNLGYIGSVLTSTLIEKGFDVTGIDIGYFENNLVSKYVPLKNQIKLDIRNISESIVEGHDAIIHLASLSNDPLGEFNPNLTNEINNLSTVKLAEIAKKVGVYKR